MTALKHAALKRASKHLGRHLYPVVYLSYWLERVQCSGLHGSAQTCTAKPLYSAVTVP